jgi:hypothetical protein
LNYRRISSWNWQGQAVKSISLKYQIELTDSGYDCDDIWQIIFLCTTVYRMPVEAINFCDRCVKRWYYDRRRDHWTICLILRGSNLQECQQTGLSVHHAVAIMQSFRRSIRSRGDISQGHRAATFDCLYSCLWWICVTSLWSCRLQWQMPSRNSIFSGTWGNERHKHRETSWRMIITHRNSLLNQWNLDGYECRT